MTPVLYDLLTCKQVTMDYQGAGALTLIHSIIPWYPPSRVPLYIYMYSMKLVLYNLLTFKQVTMDQGAGALTLIHSIIHWYPLSRVQLYVHEGAWVMVCLYQRYFKRHLVTEISQTKFRP